MGVLLRIRGRAGMSGALPLGYSEIEKRFFNMAAERNPRIQLYEYTAPGWTFHAKGLWLYDGAV